MPGSEQGASRKTQRGDSALPSGCSSAVEHSVWDRGAAGSIPANQTTSFINHSGADAQMYQDDQTTEGPRLRDAAEPNRAARQRSWRQEALFELEELSDLLDVSLPEVRL